MKQIIWLLIKIKKLILMEFMELVMYVSKNCAVVTAVSDGATSATALEKYIPKIISKHGLKTKKANSSC